MPDNDRRELAQALIYSFGKTQKQPVILNGDPRIAIRDIPLGTSVYYNGSIGTVVPIPERINLSAYPPEFQQLYLETKKKYGPGKTISFEPEEQ
jgi:hypothetical protein